MSELANNPQQIALEMAEKHRQDLERQKQEAAVSEWVDHTNEQSLDDFKEYLQTRPNEDNNGKIHHPGNGQFMKEEDVDRYFEEKRENHYEQSLETDEQGDSNRYEDMSMTELAKWLGVAEAQGDRTKAGDLQDVLLEKMVERSEKYKLSQEMQDALQDRMLKLKEEAAGQVNGHDAAKEDNSKKHTRTRTKEYITSSADTVTEESANDEQQPESENTAEVNSPELTADTLVQLAGLIHELDQEEGKDAIKAKTRKAFNMAIDGYAAKNGLSDEEKRQLREEVLEEGRVQAEAPVQEVAAETERPVEEEQTLSRWEKLKQRGRNGFNTLMLAPSKTMMWVGDKTTRNPEATEEEKRKRGLVVLGLGAAALGVAYAHQKGYIDVNPFDGDGLDLNPFNNGPEGVEGGNGNGAENGIDDNVTDGGTEGNGNETGAENEYSFSGETNVEIEQGSGYTYELKELYPNYTPQEYFEAHQAALEQFGPDYIEGVDYYLDKASGEYRLHPGRGQISEEARRFIEDFLKGKK